LAAIHVETWRAAYRGLVPDTFLASLDLERRIARYRDFVASGEREMYVIEHGRHVVGHLTICPASDEDLDSELTGEIGGIYLLPAWWRQGIGSEVFRRTEEIFRGRGCVRVVLWVFKDNQRARRFYEAMGFTVEGKTKLINAGGKLPAIRYAKRLTAGEGGLQPAACEEVR
jgi:RimJ/RimL family protein N-acetyltransferase